MKHEKFFFLDIRDFRDRDLDNGLRNCFLDIRDFRDRDLDGGLSVGEPGHQDGKVGSPGCGSANSLNNILLAWLLGDVSCILWYVE